MNSINLEVNRRIVNNLEVNKSTVNNLEAIKEY